MQAANASEHVSEEQARLLLAVAAREIERLEGLAAHFAGVLCDIAALGDRDEHWPRREYDSKCALCMALGQFPTADPSRATEPDDYED